MITIIVAHDLNNVIGDNNQLLWKQSEDLKRFKKLTQNSIVVMGRKTFDSIGKPLPNRRNVVLTRHHNSNRNKSIEYLSLDEILHLSEENDINIIGGGEIYKLFLPISHRILLTLIHAKLEGDTIFPKLDIEWVKVNDAFYHKDLKNEYDYSFIEYKK